MFVYQIDGYNNRHKYRKPLGGLVSFKLNRVVPVFLNKMYFFVCEGMERGDI